MSRFFNQIEELKKSKDAQAGIYLLTLYRNLIKAAELVIVKEYGVPESEEDKIYLVDELIKELLQRNNISDIEVRKQSIIQVSMTIPDAGAVCRMMSMKHTILENNVILEPDERERIFDGSGETQIIKGPDINRMSLIASILLSKGIDLTTLTSYEGILNDNQMRSTSYVMLPLPQYNKTLFVCNSYGEATFVIHQLLGPDDLQGISKKLLNQSGATRIIRTPDNQGGWMNRVENTLVADTNSQSREIVVPTQSDMKETEERILSKEEQKRVNTIRLWQNNKEFQNALGNKENHLKFTQGYNLDKEDHEKIIPSFLGFTIFCGISSSEGVTVNGEKKQFKKYLISGSIIKAILKKYLEKNPEFKEGEKSKKGDKDVLLTREETMEILNTDFDQLQRKYIIKLRQTDIKYQDAIRSVEIYGKFTKWYNQNKEYDKKVIVSLGGFAFFCGIPSGEEIIVNGEKKQFRNYLISGSIIKAILKKYLEKNPEFKEGEKSKKGDKDVLLTREETMEILNTDFNQSKRRKIIRLWLNDKEFQKSFKSHSCYGKFTKQYNINQIEKEKIVASFLGFVIFCDIPSGEEIEIDGEKKHFYKYLQKSSVIYAILKKYNEKNLKLKEGEKDVLLTREETLEILNSDFDQFKRQSTIELWKTNEGFQKSFIGATAYGNHAKQRNKENETQIIGSFGGFASFCDIASREEIEIDGETKPFSGYLTKGDIIKAILKKYNEKNLKLKEGEKDVLLTREETLEIL